MQNLNRIIPKFGRMLKYGRTEPSRSLRPNIRPMFGLNRTSVHLYWGGTKPNCYYFLAPPLTLLQTGKWCGLKAKFHFQNEWMWTPPWIFGYFFYPFICCFEVELSHHRRLEGLGQPQPQTINRNFRSILPHYVWLCFNGNVLCKIYVGLRTLLILISLQRIIDFVTML